METEDSIVMKEFTKRVSAALARNQVPDYGAIEHEMLRDPHIVPASFRKELKTSLHEYMGVRSQTMRNSRNLVGREWGGLLDALERFVAFGELIHERAEDMFRDGFRVLSKNNPRPNPEYVTGAVLKCLLLLGIHARSCIVSREVLLLLRNGSPDGAYSRLRTLHEHAVVMTLIANDHTYEVAERYQDHATFEYLNLLRGTRRSFSDPHWRDSESIQDSIDREIAELEADVRRTRTRWGKEIAEQYGWARPALSSATRASRSITFADLEAAAEMDFIRVHYLEGNYDVHASAHSIIRDAEFGEHIYSIRPSNVDHRVRQSAIRLVLIFGFMSGRIASSVAKETEQWDGFLLATEMRRFADQLDEKIEKWSTEDRVQRDSSPTAYYLGSRGMSLAV
jgi:hypothetical protein